ncbi:MAG TPA: protoporphyrinogen oxidase, partial [Pyrinomonadaceae bacterium]|nr:protoporphyrinogen oxidase [Pyrinomonadaceae bacterium]
SFSETNRLWKVKTNTGIFEAGTVIIALPAHISARLLSSQFPALAEKLNSIEHASSATVNIAFRRDQIEHALDGFGFVVPFVEKRTVMACTFSSVKFANRAPENFVLLRAFVGGALQPEMFALTDKEMIAGVLHDLRELLGLEGEPLFSHIARWADSMPQYTIGHLKRVAEIKDSIARIPSLELATTAIDGVGIPDAIRHGEQAADNLLKFWHSD